jgi:hypothetical protein
VELSRPLLLLLLYASVALVLLAGCTLSTRSASRITWQHALMQAIVSDVNAAFAVAEAAGLSCLGALLQWSWCSCQHSNGHFSHLTAAGLQCLNTSVG